jgi:hypothetical protein
MQKAERVLVLVRDIKAKQRLIDDFNKVIIHSCNGNAGAMKSFSTIYTDGSGETPCRLDFSVPAILIRGEFERQLKQLTDELESL